MCLHKDMNSLSIIMQDDSKELQAYITELRGIDKLAYSFRKICLDMAIAHIPNIFVGFSYQNKYFYDVPCTSDLAYMENVLKDYFSTHWWEEYAAYLLCQAIYNHPDFHFSSDVNINVLDQWVNNHLTPLNDIFYKYVGKYYISQYFPKEYEALLWDTRAMRERYISILKSHTVIHELWYATGEWKHPDLELFFHIIKLLQLGMTDGEVTPLLNELKDNGLDVPDCLLEDKWKAFKGYMFGKELITCYDVRDSFALKIRTNGDAEPLCRFLMALGPHK